VDLQKLLANVPWITKEGDIDFAQYPIERVLKQALSDEGQEFRTGLNILQSMHRAGRQDAGVFLLGMLVNCDNNLEKRSAIVNTLRWIATKGCADLLFGELKRVKSSNTTRRYLAVVIDVLSTMPVELVEEGFESLASDDSFSYKMRDKFEWALAKARFGDAGLW